MNCVFCQSSNGSLIYCPSTTKLFCLDCLSTHYSEHSSEICIGNYLCEECEQKKSSECFCSECSQRLCKDCDLRIHKKGTRAQHIRQKLEKLAVNNEICLLICTQKLLEKELIEQLKKLNKEKGTKKAVLLIMEASKEEKIAQKYEDFIEEMKKNANIESELLVFSFEKHGKNRLKTFLKTNTTIVTRKDNIKNVFLLTESLKYVDLQVLEEIFGEKSLLFHEQTKLYLSQKGLEMIEIISLELIKALELRTFENLSKGINSSKNEASFTMNILNTSSSSFETSGVFMNSQNPLNQSFNTSINHSLDQSSHLLNNSLDPSFQNKSLNSVLPKVSTQYLPYYQKFKDIEIFNNINLSYEIQKEIRKYAEEGEIMLSKSKIIEILSNLTKEPETLLKEAENLNIIHLTVRKFEGYPEKHELYSLVLDHISVESLCWILKTLRKDAMTPTEKIIVSRIKECFGLKISPKQWEKSILSLKYQKFSGDFDPVIKTNPLPKIVISKIKDPLVGNEALILKFKSIEWHVEDQGKIDEKEDNLWKLFISFLNNFFKQQKNKLQEIPEKFEKNSESEISNHDFDSKFRESIEKKESSFGILTNNPIEYPILQSEDLCKKNNTDTAQQDSIENPEGKSIPGGRYGCAQFVKTCAPEELKKCSLGKLNLYVQEAINRGLIKYHRTLLVKDYSRDEENSYLECIGNVSCESIEKTTFLQQRDAKIKALQKTLLEILKENPNGIALAQIPQFLKTRSPFSFNLQELGFPKLKNFLGSLPQRIKIEMAGTNNSFAYLLDDNKSKTSLTNQNKYGKPPVWGNQTGYSGPLAPPGYGNAIIGGIPGLAGNLGGPFGGAQIADYKGNLEKSQLKKKFNTLKYPVAENKIANNNRMGRKKVSSLEEYLAKVVGNICNIIAEQCYGIKVDRLYGELCKKLGVEFDYRLFGCQDFYSFLTNFLENESLIYIEIKNYELFVYPKNFRIGEKKQKNNEESSYNNSENKARRNEEMLKNKNTNLNLNSAPFSYSEKPAGLFTSEPPIYSNYAAKYHTLAPPLISTNQFNDSDFYSQHKKSLSIANYGTTFNQANNNVFSMAFPQSPNPFSQNNNSIASPVHNRNVSFWNINGPAFDPSTLSLHSRQESKQCVKKNEESTVEINENIRFIEELLIENDDVSLKTFYENGDSLFKSGSFSMHGLPNFGMVSAIKINDLPEKMHSKALSDDFDLNKKKFEEKNNKQHGRVQSNFEKKKMDFGEKEVIRDDDEEFKFYE